MRTFLFNFLIFLLTFLAGSCTDANMADRRNDDELDSASLPTQMSPPPTPIATGFNMPVGYPDGNNWNLNGGWGYMEYESGYDYNGNWFDNHVYHPGEDLNLVGANDCGTEIRAAANGIVTESANFGTGWGNIIEIKSTLPDGTIVWLIYAHEEIRYVAIGDVVNQGDLIGLVGGGSINANGDYEYPCHLHLEVRLQDRSAGYWPSGMAIGALDHVIYTNPRDFINTHRTIAPPVPTCDTDLARYEVRALQLFGADLYGHYHYEDASQNAVLGHVGPPILNMNNLTALVGMQVGNLNGDAWDDVLHITNEAGTTYFYVRRGNEDDILLTRQTWKTTTRVVNQTFLGDFDGDGRDDLILGLPIAGNKMEWYSCRNEGSKFADSCTFWRATGTADGTFGEVGNVFVVGDFDGNGKVELVRGKKNTAICATGHEWKRLQPNGDRFDLTWNGITCFAPTTKGFFAANVDNDGKDEFVYVRSDDSSVEVYVSNFNESTSEMTWALWANDVGGSDGTYFVYDITRDGKADVMLWGNDVLKYSKNLGSSFWEQSRQLTLGTYPKGGKNTLLFGLFGVHELYTDPCP